MVKIPLNRNLMYHQMHKVYFICGYESATFIATVLAKVTMHLNETKNGLIGIAYACCSVNLTGFLKPVKPP